MRGRYKVWKALFYKLENIKLPQTSTPPAAGLESRFLNY